MAHLYIRVGETIATGIRLISKYGIQNADCFGNDLGIIVMPQIL